MKLTRRQRYLACALNPTYGKACTRAEVIRWRKLLAGTIIDEYGWRLFCAFNRKGKLKYFDYCHRPFESRGCCDNKLDSLNYYAVKSAAKKWANR
jgi:hypothetical protein